jgi:hypothetical protein
MIDNRLIVHTSFYTATIACIVTIAILITQ